MIPMKPMTSQQTGAVQAGFAPPLRQVPHLEVGDADGQCHLQEQHARWERRVADELLPHDADAKRNPKFAMRRKTPEVRPYGRIRAPRVIRAERTNERGRPVIDQRSSPSCGTPLHCDQFST